MSKPSSRTTVLLFSRSPTDQKAKSRLQRTLPPSLVTQLHSAFVLDTLTALQTIAERVEIVCSWSVENENEISLLRHLIPARHEIQQGVSFAEKLTNSLLNKTRLASGPIVVIGSDCPLLSPQILVEAIEATESGSLVIGPAPLGGFYLAGLPEKADINGFGEVFQDALEVCALREKYNTLPLHLLPFLYDIDLEEDLVSLLGDLRLIHENILSSKIHPSQTWLPEKTYHILKGLHVMRNESSRDKKIVCQ
ncbi:MAG: TIGR04282 family arsenosugar biosynthesis glycosyltransferase [Bdellovibrionota bacterium]